MFVLHKLFTREIAFWRDIASSRKAQGISCCECCAAIGDFNICPKCENFSNDPRRYDWFKNAILGKPSLQSENLNTAEVQERLANMPYSHLSLKQNIIPTPYATSYFGDYNGNIDWQKKLAFYTDLEEPFDDLYELYSQWARFRRILP